MAPSAATLSSITPSAVEIPPSLPPLPERPAGSRRVGVRGSPVLVVRCGGMAIAVPRAEHAAATLVGTTAVRLVREWGLVSAQSVADRARALSPEPISDDRAHAVLLAMPRARWLDEARRWFSFADPLGRMNAALAKVFAVVGAIRFDELRAALSRSLVGAGQAPAPVLRRYLVELGRCAIAPVARRSKPDELDAALVRRVSASPRDDADAGPIQPLTRPEGVLVHLLARAGGELDARTLRQLAGEAGVPRTTVNQLVKSSPVLAPIVPEARAAVAPPRVRLIGHRSHAVGA